LQPEVAANAVTCGRQGGKKRVKKPRKQKNGEKVLHCVQQRVPEGQKIVEVLLPVTAQPLTTK
jgi:hypothetical protein